MTVSVEFRRHSARHHDEWGHLTQDGVDLARGVGESMGEFDLVASSPRPRAAETAIAMGYGVDRELPDLARVGSGAMAEIDWPMGFAEFAKRMAPGSELLVRGVELAGLLLSIARELPAGGSALLLSHGAVIEMAAVASTSWLDHVSWGPHCGHCEGVLLHYDGGKCTDATPIRVVGAT